MKHLFRRHSGLAPIVILPEVGARAITLIKPGAKNSRKMYPKFRLSPWVWAAILSTAVAIITPVGFSHFTPAPLGFSISMGILFASVTGVFSVMIIEDFFQYSGPEFDVETDDFMLIARPYPGVVSDVRDIMKMISSSPAARDTYGTLLQDLLWEYRHDQSTATFLLQLRNLEASCVKFKRAEERRDLWANKNALDQLQLEKDLAREIEIARRVELEKRISETHLEHTLLNRTLDEFEQRERLHA